MSQTADEPLLEEERVVLYEAPQSAFPVAGGAFAPSFYNESTGRCELDKFVTFMDENPERKQAWLEILDLSESDFGPLMDRLQEARVTEHTAVTNHGYRDGKWFEVNSVLAPGTPVMIDPARMIGGGPIDEVQPSPSISPEPTPEETVFEEQTPEPTVGPTPTPPPKDDWVIVVKCTCGNPILPPKCPPNCGEETPPPSPSPSDTAPPRTDTPRTNPPPTESPEDTFPPTESPPDDTFPPRTPTSTAQGGLA